MRGPAPKPTKLKQLEGNPGKRPLNASEPKPSDRLFYAPRWMSDMAKREWRRIAPELRRLGLLTMVDLTALATCCEAFAEWREALRVLAVEGYTYTTDSGYVGQHPMVAVKNKAALLMKALLCEFGMTPSSRSRLHIEPPTPEDPLLAHIIARSRQKGS